MVIAGLLCLVAGAKAQDAEPVASPAADAIFQAFETHPLVGVGDHHELAQEEDFIAALIRDPRFARGVGNIVVENGGAIHQDTIDRYVNGAAVSYEELRKVWTDTVGWIPSGTPIGIINLFAQVREINAGLPESERVHIWLGDPVIDWKTVKTQKDWFPIVRTRDTHAATLIEQQILARHKKALVLYGSLHFAVDTGEPLKNLKELVEDDYPHAFYLALPYTGFVEKDCALAFEQRTRGWPVPAIASPVRGNWLAAALQRDGCHVVPPAARTYSGLSDEVLKKVKQRHAEIDSGVAGDGLLYLGPASTLTISQQSPDIYLDPAFRAEEARRYQIITGHPMTGSTAKDNPVATQYLRSYR